ncbi:hypothetical protein F5Y11DRAFT_351332 [Daldinia sp. FL1419]|nr:hypothetical protein F5Y11DRAFT_351332 [Daldinia sp. FL1419]
MAGIQETEDGIEDNHADDKKLESCLDSLPDDPQEIEMANSPMMSTPAHSSLLPSSMPNSGCYTGPVTRSMTKVHHASLVNGIPYIGTSLGRRLQESSKKHTSSSHVSRLEESRDIGHVSDERINERVSDFDGVNDDVTSEVRDRAQPLESPSLKRTSALHPMTGQLRVPVRRSARLNNDSLMISGTTNSIIIKPSDRERARRSTKRLKRAHATIGGPVRRSPRLSKPLTEFTKYIDLPAELKMMIWEAAIEPRLVYILNRYSLSHVQVQFEVQNQQPTWFNTCRLSRWVAQLHYLRLFSMYSPVTGSSNLRTSQAVTYNDIVIFEPCHGGCRGCYCARHQYDLPDRSTVRYLAVQAESPNLPPTTEPCWQTITRSWNNVETLYLMRTAVKGVDKRDKAMIRVKPSDHEAALLKRFEEWKKGPGIGFKVKKLEFVVVVEKEGSIASPQDRYQTIEDRLTGQQEDIIIG